MVFSSIDFLFLFLPLVIVSYVLTGGRNVVLCLWSLLFYFIGEGWSIWILVVSILVAYLHGMHLSTAGPKKPVLVIAVAAQLMLLGYFKYSYFLAVDVFRLSELDHQWPALPIGVSFFVFQAISYSVDIYRRDHQPNRSLIDVATYIAMFPQLVAGPIVRYGKVAKALLKRRVHLRSVKLGLYFLCIGLAQKVLVANRLAVTADGLFALDPDLLMTATAWTAALSYTGQIYFDFAGYSSMAIGLGLLLGFRFPRNFNHPYISQSITEYWARWHISLTNWFRDYVYIPLGGNRNGSFITYRNLFVVFLISGLWHGAAWTFLIWGMYHGMFLVLERAFLLSFLKRIWSGFSWLYMMLVVVVGFVLFRADSIGHCMSILKKMFSFSSGDSSYFFLYSSADIWIAMLAAVLFSTEWPQRNLHALCMRTGFSLAYSQTVICVVLVILSLMDIVSSSYNPFIYYRF